MHPAGRRTEAVQKLADEIGAVQRRFADSRSGAHGAAMAPHQLSKLASHPRFEQPHANAGKSVTPLLGH